MSAVTALSSSALPIATNAIKQSQNGLAQDANVVANSTAADSPDTLAALVDSRQQVLYTDAAAKLISASDEMLGSLLDINA